MKKPSPTFIVNATITVLLVANLAVMVDIRRRLLNIVPKIPRGIELPEKPPSNLARHQIALSTHFREGVGPLRVP